MDPALGPTVPFINVQVRATDRCNFDFDENVTAPETGNFDIANVHARRSLWLDDRQHGFRHQKNLMSTGLISKLHYSSTGALLYR